MGQHAGEINGIVHARTSGPVSSPRNFPEIMKTAAAEEQEKTLRLHTVLLIFVLFMPRHLKESGRPPLHKRRIAG